MVIDGFRTRRKAERWGHSKLADRKTKATFYQSSYHVNGGVLRSSWGCFGPSCGPLEGVFGACWWGIAGIREASWKHLGPSWADRRPSWEIIRGFLGPSSRYSNIEASWGGRNRDGREGDNREGKGATEKARGQGNNTNGKNKIMKRKGEGRTTRKVQGGCPRRILGGMCGRF